jgi:hypothetical protein
MDRREFLRSAAAASATLNIPRLVRALEPATTPETAWRTFEVTTRVEILNPSGVSMVWLPAAQLQQAPHDVALPGSKNAPINYFMYPQAETAGARVDPFDPDKFKYAITSKELTAA